MQLFALPNEADLDVVTAPRAFTRKSCGNATPRQPNPPMRNSSRRSNLDSGDAVIMKTGPFSYERVTQALSRAAIRFQMD